MGRRAAIFAMITDGYEAIRRPPAALARTLYCLPAAGHSGKEVSMFRGIRILVAGLVANAALGCTVADQAEKFREPIPTAADVALATPREGSATPTKSGLATAAPTGYAKYYQFTRNVNDAVDLVTAVVLGSVWLVVHTPPAIVDAKHAVWGPGQGDALSPVVWRLTVTEIAQGDFDYQLDGRPKDSLAESDYLAVLKGHGHGRAHP
jgi:hypothetical protein